MSKETLKQQAESKQVESREAQKPQESKKQENQSNKNIPSEVLELVGERFIINEVTKIVSRVSPNLFDITFENAVMTHGSKNIRTFLCEKNNVAELYAILKQYKNGVLKD